MTMQAESVKRELRSGGDDEGKGGRASWSRGRIVGVGVAVVALVAAFLFTRDGTVEQLPEPPTDGGEELAIDPLTGIPEGYERYHDEATGFSLAHPETWVPLARPQGDRRLLLSAGADSSLSVRYNVTAEPIDTEADLQKVRAATDLLAEGAEGAQVVKRQAFNLNGINGISYLSRFTDPETDRSFVNALYFLFQGTRQYTVLFQIAPFPPTAPEDDFTRLLPDINAVLDSFTIEPGEAPPIPVG